MNREAFFAHSKRRTKQSTVMPGATIQSLTAEEMRRLRGGFQTKDGSLNWKRVNRVNELLICATIVGDDGGLIFTEEHAFSVDMDRMDGAIVAALGAEIKEFVGWNADTDAKAIEDALKNSRGTPSEQQAAA